MNFTLMSSRFAMLLVTLATPPVFGEEPVLPYQYTNDWSLVSAPPPAGPYRPVNIDPRVPGPGSVPELPMLPLQPDDKTGGTPGNDGIATTDSNNISQQSTSDPAVVEQEISASIPGAPPAAGIPAQSPAYNYPPPGYPYQSMYRGGQGLPPPGYYNPARRDAEPEVPPPPVYDGMYGPRPYQDGGW